MKLLVIYANCQAWGLFHFLRQTKLAEHYEFKSYTNFRIILKEESAEELMRDVAKADIFVHQPTSAIQHCELSSEDMIARVIPKGCLPVSFAYAFNHGFFPIVHHGQWQTGRQVLDLAASCPEALWRMYEQETISFDCALRFISCLREQMNREKAMSVKMGDFILNTFQKEQLFICENHPASAYFAEEARRILRYIEMETGTSYASEIAYSGFNEAKMPGGMLVSPAAVKELALEYPAEQGAHKYFGEFVERLIKEKQAAC